MLNVKNNDEAQVGRGSMETGGSRGAREQGNRGRRKLGRGSRGEGGGREAGAGGQGPGEVGTKIKRSRRAPCR